MNEDYSEKPQGIIKKVIKGYNNAQTALVKKIIDNFSNITNENIFLDDGTIQAQINRLKKHYTVICNEINAFSVIADNNDKYSAQKIKELLNERQHIHLQMAFLASNSFENLDSCLELIENVETDFHLCIHALKAYKSGEKEVAFCQFNKYFSDKAGLLEHYLINKTYGLLLSSWKQYEQAILLLRKAVEKRPEDLETHIALKDIYREIGFHMEEAVELEIIKLLGGVA